MRALKRFLISVLLLGAATLFANDVATITGLVGSASVHRDTALLTASLGDKLQEKDSVITKDKSKAQIIFKDETIINIGNNTNFSIKEYLYEDTKEPVAKFGMIKGAMRAITGKIAKVAPEKFSVETKTATIGIRGTNFMLIVNEDGSIKAYCTYGAISVTFNNQVYVVKQGYVIEITFDGKVEIKKFTPQNLKDVKSRNFAFSTVNERGTSSSDETAYNDSQLDTTTMDDSTIEVKNATDSWADSSQANSGEGITESSVIAGYSMTGAVYTGDFVTTSKDQTTSTPDSGYAQLDVNFNADTATLEFKQSSAGASIVTFDFTDVNSNTISTTSATLGGAGGATTGSADGTFYGTSGNSVKGNFSFDENGVANGTYNVNSSQTLH